MLLAVHVANWIPAVRRPTPCRRRSNSERARPGPHPDEEVLEVGGRCDARLVKAHAPYSALARACGASAHQRTFREILGDLVAPRTGSRRGSRGFVGDGGGDRRPRFRNHVLSPSFLALLIRGSLGTVSARSSPSASAPCCVRGHRRTGWPAATSGQEKGHLQHTSSALRAGCRRPARFSSPTKLGRCRRRERHRQQRHVQSAEDRRRRRTRERYQSRCRGGGGEMACWGAHLLRTRNLSRTRSRTERQGGLDRHNPRSNMNNGVGYAPAATMRPRAWEGRRDRTCWRSAAAFPICGRRAARKTYAATVELLAGGIAAGASGSSGRSMPEAGDCSPRYRPPRAERGQMAGHLGRPDRTRAVRDGGGKVRVARQRGGVDGRPSSRARQLALPGQPWVLPPDGARV